MGRYHTYVMRGIPCRFLDVFRKASSPVTLTLNMCLDGEDAFLDHVVRDSIL